MTRECVRRQCSVDRFIIRAPSVCGSRGGGGAGRMTTTRCSLEDGSRAGMVPGT